MRPFWLCPALALVAIFVYLNSFPGAFHYDDFPLVLENPRVQNPTFSYSAFGDQYAGRPLTMWSFHANYQLFGATPWSFLMVNVALHALVAGLLFLLVQRLFQQPMLAFYCALLFAVHPLQTQAVNYVWSRSVLLMAAFGLASLLLVRRSPVAALIVFQLAIWSRTEAVVLVLPLMFLNRARWRSILALGVINTGAFLYSLWKYTPGEVGWNHSDPVHYWFLQPNALLKYLSLMIWPVGLNVDHDVEGAWWLGVLLLVVFVSLLVLLWGIRARQPVPVVGIFWMVLMLSPSLLIPDPSFVNESRAYLSLAGFSLLAGWLVLGMVRDWPLFRRWVALLVPIVLLVPMTLARNEIWKDDVRLWADSVQKSPAKGRPHYNLGVALARQGQQEASEVHFRRARDLNPTDDYSRAALGYCAELRDDYESARSFYEEAIHLNPENDYAREGLVRMTRSLGREEALQP